jgi:hypothetical protein
LSEPDASYEYDESLLPDSPFFLPESLPLYEYEYDE